MSGACLECLERVQNSGSSKLKTRVLLETYTNTIQDTSCSTYDTYFLRRIKDTLQTRVVVLIILCTSTCTYLLTTYIAVGSSTGSPCIVRTRYVHYVRLQYHTVGKQTDNKSVRVRVHTVSTCSTCTLRQQSTYKQSIELFWHFGFVLYM